MKLKKKGKEIVWGTRTKVEVKKNHVTNLSTRGKLIITAEGFILEEDEKKYLEEHSNQFLEYLEAASMEEIETVEEANDE